MELIRKNYSSGSPLEEKTGYSRMITVGPFVYIGGTTAVQSDGTVYGIGSAYEQSKFILKKFISLLEKSGVKKEEVIKVKCYATDMSYAPEIAKAYSEFFFEIKPLLTIVGINMLNRPTQLVEIELDAIIGSTVKQGL